MKKPVPIHKESPFHADEFFFSTTDARGVIEIGNNVFVRVSGYKKNELIGKAHNIIRHPDMPRCVFKLFWDTLKTGSPITAYVKNLAADGSYYWVFASAYPVNDGYLSIRFKPTSEIFKLVQDLYVEVLKKEKESSMEAAEAYLLEKLNSLGFKSYKQFMIHAAVTELNSLESFISKDKTADREFAHINEIKTRTVFELDKSFSKISHFSACTTSFTGNISKLENEFKKLKCLSVNMSVLAHKYGSEAASISVIAEYFSNLAGQIASQLKTFSEFTDKLIVMIEDFTLDLVSLKTQMNMVNFFVKESIETHAFDEMIQTEEIFNQLFSVSAENLISQSSLLRGETGDLGIQLSEIQKFINGLEIIKQTGSIESARKDEIKASFSIYLQEMSAFTQLLRQAITELNSKRQSLQHDSAEIRASVSNIKSNVQLIYQYALKNRQLKAG